PVSEDNEDDWEYPEGGAEIRRTNPPVDFGEISDPEEDYFADRDDEVILDGQYERTRNDQDAVAERPLLVEEPHDEEVFV
ncbi:hypothetical protein PMAYCL1PPCAC_08881, partial [Pristionchus mayeri]